MKGILVAIEGIDGAGKSTLVNEIVSTCKEYNFNKLSGVGGYFFTKELRSIEEKMNKYEELLLSEEVKNIAWMMDFYITGKKIEKMLERGENVIVDRYTLSAKVYAESTTSVNMDDYFSIYTLLPTPDVWIIVDVEPNIALERIYKRNKVTLTDASAMISYYGWLKHCNSYNFNQKYIRPYIDINKLKGVVSYANRKFNKTK